MKWPGRDMSPPNRTPHAGRGRPSRAPPPFRSFVHARREIARARRASRTAPTHPPTNAPAYTRDAKSPAPVARRVLHTHAPTYTPRTRTHQRARVHARREIRSDQITRKQLSKYLQLELPIELPLIRLHTDADRRPPARIEQPPRTAFFKILFD